MVAGGPATTSIVSTVAFTGSAGSVVLVGSTNGDVTVQGAFTAAAGITVSK